VANLMDMKYVWKDSVMTLRDEFMGWTLITLDDLGEFGVDADDLQEAENAGSDELGRINSQEAENAGSDELDELGWTLINYQEAENAGRVPPKRRGLRGFLASLGRREG